MVLRSKYSHALRAVLDTLRVCPFAWLQPFRPGFAPGMANWFGKLIRNTGFPPSGPAFHTSLPRYDCASATPFSQSASGAVTASETR